MNQDVVPGDLAGIGIADDLIAGAGIGNQCIGAGADFTHAGELGEAFADQLVQREHALFAQSQECGAGEQLAQGCHVETGFVVALPGLAGVGTAHGELMDDLAVVHNTQLCGGEAVFCAKVRDALVGQGEIQHNKTSCMG